MTDTTTNQDDCSAKKPTFILVREHIEAGDDSDIPGVAKKSIVEAVSSDDNPRGNVQKTIDYLERVGEIYQPREDRYKIT